MPSSVLPQRFPRPCLGAMALACLLPAGMALAQTDDGGGPLRERLKQRWLDRRAAHPPADAAGTADRIDRPGDHTRSLEHDGLTRSYRVHVPRSYDPARAAPLLLAFHGGGGDMEHMATDRLYGLISKSEAEGFILVFPNGYSRLQSGKFATWNAGACCAQARDRKVDDVGFVRTLIREVTHEFAIDRQRIFATGMSNGAMMAYRLACEMADTFKAIAAVAGTDNTLGCAPAAPISILHIHAADDDHVLFQGCAGKTFRDPSTVTDFRSVPATVARWLEFNHCKPKPQAVTEHIRDPRAARCERYAPCQGGVAVQLCVTSGGGHSWPGGSKPRSDQPPSQALSANELMWAFFTAR